MSARPRVMLAGFTDVAGHVGRLLTLAGALRDAGVDEVSLLGAGRFAREARRAGCTVREERERTLDLFGVEDAELARRTFETWFRLQLTDDLTILQRTSPDCVVVDGRWPMMAAARLLGIRTVTITNAIWTRARHGLGLASEEHFAAFASLFADAARRTLERLDVALEPDIDAFQEGDHTHLSDIRALISDASGLAGPVSIGPLLWRPAAPVVDWPAGTGPKIYMTNGTTGIRADVATAAAALAARGARVVLSGASDAGACANLVCTPFCDAPALLRTADVAVVHGGSGSMTQALEYAVPTVVCPSNFDQQANGELLERAGAGLCAIGSDDVVAAVDRLMSEHAFAASAQRLAAGIALDADPSALAEVVVRVATGARV